MNRLAAVLYAVLLALVLCGCEVQVDDDLEDVLIGAPQRDYVGLEGMDLRGYVDSGFAADARWNVELYSEAVGYVHQQAYMHACAPEEFTGYLNLISSEDDATLNYRGWPVEQGVLARALVAGMNWNQAEEEVEGNHVYLLDTDNEAAMLVDGGYLIADEDTMIDVVAVLEGSSDEALIDDVGFQSARELADFSATFFELEWDEIEDRGSDFEEWMEEVIDEETFIDTLDKDSITAHWRADYLDLEARVVRKIRFAAQEDATTFADGIRNSKADLLREQPSFFLPSEVYGAMDDADLDDLDDQLSVTVSEDVVAIEFSFTWEDIDHCFDEVVEPDAEA